MASTTSYTKIFPSPICPVRAALAIASSTFIHARGGNHQFQPDLGQQIHVILLPAIDLLMPFLAAVATHLADGHAIDSNVKQSLPFTAHP